MNDDADAKAKLMLGHRLSDNQKWLIGIIVGLVSLVATIILSSYVVDGLVRWSRSPTWVKIRAKALDGTEKVSEAGQLEVREGTEVRLTAETFPPNTKLNNCVWNPIEMIYGDGQSVTLKTGSGQHLDSYSITVTLIAEDGIGNPAPTPESVTIKVVPARYWNNKPEIDSPIHAKETRQQIWAGDPVTLKAHAVDADKDKLTYKWRVDSEAVKLDGDETPEVTLHIPRDFVGSGFDLLKVTFTVKDGYKDGIAIDEKNLVVKAKPAQPTSKRRRTGGGTPKIYVITVQPSTIQQQPQPSVIAPPASPPVTTPAPTQQQESAPKPLTQTNQPSGATPQMEGNRPTC